MSILLGLWSGLFIVYVTGYRMSRSHTPVCKIAETQKQHAATGISYGLALGYVLAKPVAPTGMLLVLRL